MFTRRLGLLRGRPDRGLYFPINHRIVDQRVAPEVAEVAEVQGRYRRQLRTSFTTREVRQTEAPAWSQRARPTHFLSLPLPERNSLTGRVREVRDAVVFTHPEAEALFVPLAKLHVTLGVMTLPDAADGSAGQAKTLQAIADCVQAACRDECRGPLRLRFRGLGTFDHGRVLFAQCIAEEHFSTLDRLVRRLRRDLGLGLGVDMKGNPHDSYVPHVTLAKIRARQREKFGHRIPMEMWAPFQHNDFGDVTFARVDVCNMKGQGEKGYYKVESTAKLAVA